MNEMKERFILENRWEWDLVQDIPLLHPLNLIFHISSVALSLISSEFKLLSKKEMEDGSCVEFRWGVTGTSNKPPCNKMNLHLIPIIIIIFAHIHLPPLSIHFLSTFR